MAKPIKPEVLEWMPIAQGNLRGLFTARVGPCEFRKCRFVQQDGQTPFVSPPQESYTDREGQKRYVTLVKWPTEWNGPLLQAVLDAQRDYPQGLRQQSRPAFSEEVRRRAGIGGAP